MNQNNLKLGDWNAICDVCGFKFKASDLQKRWDNLYVCKEDFEHRHPMDFFKGHPDDPSVSWARPESADSGGTDIEGNTYPPTRADTTTDVPEGHNDGGL